MARIGINTGNTANDGTGDTLRAAGGIINSNFLELYTYLGAGSTTTLSAPVWNTTNAGINTLRNVGIGTTNPRFALEVGAVGASGTSLLVNGDARVTGILTIGTASITLDGSNNKIRVGSGITIDGNSGIISASSIVLNGSTLSGSAVTFIAAGAGISVSQNTGQVTITASGGASSQWVTTAAGIHTLSNVGIGTTNPTSKLTVSGGGNFTGVVTASSFRPSSGYIQASDGTNSFYIYGGTGNVAFQGTISASQINNASGYKALDFGATTTPSVNVTNSLNVGSGASITGVVTATSFVGNLTGTATTAATVDILNTNGLTTIYYPTFVENRTDGQILRGDVDLTYRTDTNTLTVPNVSATTFTGALTGNATGLSGTPNINVANITAGIATFGSATGNAGVSDVLNNSGGRTYISPGQIQFNSTGNIQQIGSQQYFRAGTSGASSYYFSNYYGGFDNELVFIDTNGNVRIAGNLNVSGISTLGTFQVSSGIVTASSGIITYYGDTSNTVDGRWVLGANGSSDYTFTGIGFTQTTNDPVLYLARGRVYEFVNNSGGSHPFQIRLSNGGAAYSDGVTNNSAATGVIRFEVPFNAPNTLYYQCTNHSGMGNTISVYPNTI